MEYVLCFTADFIKEIASADEEVLDKYYDNFVVFFEQGWGPEGLPGRYKPSWEMPYIKTSFQISFMDIAKQNNLFHYHFGFKDYQDSNDEKYSGKVSEGLIHTRIENIDKVERHVALQLCLEHGSPFKVPWDRSNSPVVTPRT
ncbi:hypothetical protein [Rheinheimera salexigens]|uniref:Uncharacterized protein n=1 Tax=Rheinheimera salexigens TaxID=1628148 RepID=A0A1E7Q881_9GAMM|nr:hypothetical protein [Rheinheimera salexigens]OEY70320.1 hypothetical protein BI198_12635 [Rheinheimera salexigens]